ncbi:homeodomain-like protein [Tanacetum coccineum]
MLRAFPMSLTGAVSHWLRNEPIGSITTWDGFKTKFLNKYCPPARTAKKMEEINNFLQEPDENLYQAWERFKELLMKCPQHYLTDMQEEILFYNGLGIPTRQILDSRGAIPSKTAADAKIKKVNEKVYAAQVGYEQCKGPHYTKECPLKEEGKTLKEAHYTQFGGPFQGGGYRAAALGFYQRNNINPSYQEQRQSMEDTLSKNQGASIKTLEIQIGKISKLLQENGFGSLPSSTEANPRDQVKSISTTIEADSYPIRRIGSSQYAVSTGQNRILMTVKYPKGIAENILVGALMNVLIFVGTYSVVTDFVVLENMNAYRDEGMGDVIFGEPFLREVGIKVRWFKGMITIYNGNESVTYQMVRSHPRFKHHTNAHYNKIPPLLKVNDEDKKNEISHPYQKLKGFYKGVLNLGPDYIQDVKMEEWPTRGHISVHEME